MKYITLIFVFVALFFCSCINNKTEVTPSSDVQTEDTLRTITKEMAFEGVNNYCHKEYDWSVAKDNPDIMYVQLGEETDSAYQVVFRSYTGALCIFMSIRQVVLQEWLREFRTLMSKRKQEPLSCLITWGNNNLSWHEHKTDYI